MGKLSWSARAPITKYHTLGSLKNRNIFLIVLGAGSTDQGVSRLGCLLGLQMAALSLYPHMALSLWTHRKIIFKRDSHVFHRVIKCKHVRDFVINQKIRIKL